MTEKKDKDRAMTDNPAEKYPRVALSDGIYRVWVEDEHGELDSEHVVVPVADLEALQERIKKLEHVLQIFDKVDAPPPATKLAHRLRERHANDADSLGTHKLLLDAADAIDRLTADLKALPPPAMELAQRLRTCPYCASTGKVYLMASCSIGPKETHFTPGPSSLCPHCVLKRQAADALDRLTAQLAERDAEIKRLKQARMDLSRHPAPTKEDIV